MHASNYIKIYVGNLHDEHQEFIVPKSTLKDASSYSKAVLQAKSEVTAQTTNIELHYPEDHIWHWEMFLRLLTEECSTFCCRDSNLLAELWLFG